MIDLNIKPKGEPGEWDEDSLAIVASDGDGNGAILWYIGAHMEQEIREYGLGGCLADLGLDDAPIGLSVWVGKYAARECGNPLDGTDWESYPVGSFRDLTEDEWAAVREKRNPWEVSPPRKEEHGAQENDPDRL